MKLNNSHLNVSLFLLTLAASAAYLILGGYRLEQDFLVVGGILLVLLLIVLAARGFQKPFASSLPIFAVFWAFLYTLLPNASNLSYFLDSFGPSLGRFFSAAVSVLPLLLVALAAIFLLRKFAKDSRHFLIVVLYYLAYGTALTSLFMAAVYAVLPSESEILRAALLGPVFFGGVCLCLELSASFTKTDHLYRKAFFWLTLSFGFLILFVGPTAMWSIERLLMGADYRLIATLAVVLLGVLLLPLNTTIDDYDDVCKGYGNQILACFFFLWGAYSLLTMVWPQFFHQLVFLFGAPLAYLLYAFLRRFHGKKLPLMQKMDNSFLAVYSLAALVLLLALGRTVTIRPLYPLLIAVLLVVRYICNVLADKTQKPLVIHCFQGVAALILLSAARLDLLTDPAQFPMAALLVISLFWCVVCFFLAKASTDTTRVYPSEYAFVNQIRTGIPAVLAVLALLLLLFR